MTVTCPPGVSCGADVMVSTPQGQKLMVKVPAGIGPGDTFQVQVPAHGPSPTQLMMVTVPPGVKPGGSISIMAPSGQAVQVVVPAGVNEGGQFQVSVPVAAETIAVAAPVAPVAAAPVVAVPTGATITPVGSPPAEPMMQPGMVQPVMMQPGMVYPGMVQPNMVPEMWSGRLAPPKEHAPNWWRMYKPDEGKGLLGQDGKFMRGQGPNDCGNCLFGFFCIPCAHGEVVEWAQGQGGLGACIGTCICPGFYSCILSEGRKASEHAIHGYHAARGGARISLTFLSPFPAQLPLAAPLSSL